MKYLILVPDGMADYPIRELSWRTPLMVADAPGIKSLGSKGEMGLFQSIPKGAQAGSDVANMSIMGYDPVTQLTGRGALEASALGIELDDDEIAFRCNLITCNGDAVTDYSAGYIPTVEGNELMQAMKEEFDDDAVSFHGGNSFRNILVLKGPDVSEELQTTPPHDIVGQSLSSYLPRALDQRAQATEALLRKLISESSRVLDDHPVNRKRRKEGNNPGNMIWPWSPGRRLRLKPFKKIWGLAGSAISAVDTVKGLARSAGMSAPDVPGATGFIDTDYEAKADAALAALRKCDLVYVHVEAIDEMGHSGDVRGKIQAIESFDSRLVARLFAGLESRGIEYRVAVIPDHYTPCTVKTHVRDPTPFAIAPHDASPDGPGYDEESAKQGRLGILEGDGFLRELLA